MREGIIEGSGEGENWKQIRPVNKLMYKSIRNKKYDYIGQAYSASYPNLHKYPATMLPQIGIDILKELKINDGVLLDPYCGSGSSFICALECGIKKMSGRDINPLAVLVSKTKFTKVSIDKVLEERRNFRNSLYEFIKNERDISVLPVPQITNMDFWFSHEVKNNLIAIKYFIDKIKDEDIKNFFLIAFSQTVRQCSYARNDEFKLVRMKSVDLLNFNPDVIGIYFKFFDTALYNYRYFYLPKLKDDVSIKITHSEFKESKEKFDIVLTSPPYGDSRTTVAYGQFSALSNEWMGIEHARKIDGMLMGGRKVKENIKDEIICDFIGQIDKVDKKRALEVSSFYYDLQESIDEVAGSMNTKATAIYIVGNRCVKNVDLPTDRFVAKKFEQNGFKHLMTYKRLISNKAMPIRNSPTNKKGSLANTMMYEYIVVCRR
jgi:16S rRNA G966 N2-methylase RsmD